MKLNIPATDLPEDEIEDPLIEDIAPWIDNAGDSSDTDDETGGTPVEEDPNIPQTTASSTEIDNVSELVQDDWDPTCFEHEGASAQCLLRIQDDMLDLFENPLPGVLIEAKDISRFYVAMVGPSGTTYEGRLLLFLLQCPPNYPTRSPRVRLLNNHGVSLGPKLCASGKVCLDILGTTDNCTWSPVHSVKTVLMAIQSLLMEAP
ncbi:ubiquitin-conjugating enzyme E2 Z-like [Rhipicephalus microplus]|uniref:ubiquitin-conjugating enzyme E2 Z-like n=1 Tax=Rhipicephalus microplus TaxID=6941 RepID=UPI003F6D1F5C